MTLCTVVCPIYKNQLNHFEEIAVRNNISKLEKHKFIFIYPKGLNIEYYKKIAFNNASFISLDRSHFHSIRSYNKLILSDLFWNLFKTEYLLICQTDCWVFRDELHQWITLSLDYIGAPWHEGFNHPIKGAKIIGVGNGGFSLRHIERTKTALKKFSWLIFLKSSILNFRFKNIYYFFKANFSPKGLNEDKFFGFCLPDHTDFRVANIPLAIQFCFETNPENLFLKNHKKLPFACHGWNKYSPQFWKLHIPELKEYFHSILANNA